MNSEQLQLDLRMPWDGYSPRSLTRIAMNFTFRAGTGRVNRESFETPDVLQLELFPEGTHYGS